MKFIEKRMKTELICHIIVQIQEILFTIPRHGCECEATSRHDFHPATTVEESKLFPKLFKSILEISCNFFSFGDFAPHTLTLHSRYWPRVQFAPDLSLCLMLEISKCSRKSLNSADKHRMRFLSSSRSSEKLYAESINLISAQSPLTHTQHFIHLKSQ